MDRFIRRFGSRIIGVLSGFDRLVLRGTLRRIAYAKGMKHFLDDRHVLLKDFAAYAERVTARVKEASLEAAKDLERPVEYLPSSGTDKEALARKIAERDGITEGPIAVFTTLETCRSYEIHRNREAKKLEIQPRIRKCLFLYHSRIHPRFGFLHVRIQSWFPFSIQICLNGREWLGREMDRAGLRYRRRDNCFPWIEDVPKAQRLLDRQVPIAWPLELRRLARLANPAHERIFEGTPIDSYGSAYQSEWATDLMFRDAASLAAIYPALVRHALATFSSSDVMRFLGGKVHGAFRGEIVSDFKNRPEGVRIKHRVGNNSLQLYDKQGSVLRAEATLNNPSFFQVFRRKESDPKGKLAWRPLRKGIADLHRRVEVSQAANERYLDALSSAATDKPLGDLLPPVCRSTRWKGKPVRGLRPWSDLDRRLIQAVMQGEFSLSGFRNRDLQALLFDTPTSDPKQRRRRSAQVTRLLRMLRAHGMIQKLPKTSRYRTTRTGHDVLTAILTLHRVSVDQLNKCAA